MSCAACKNARGYTTRCPYCGEPGDVTREQMRIAKRQADALEKIAESTNTAPRSDLLTWLNAEHLAAQQAYQAERNPYHEGAVDALDRVIARVEGGERAERLGERVRKLRGERGWTLDAVAKETGISKGALSHIENNKSESPHATTLRKLASAFGVTIGHLLQGGPVRPPSVAKVDTAPLRDLAKKWSDYSAALLARRDPGDLVDLEGIARDQLTECAEQLTAALNELEGSIAHQERLPAKAAEWRGLVVDHAFEARRTDALDALEAGR